MNYNVDITAANNLKQNIATFLDKSNADSPVLNKVGAFASLYKLDLSNYVHPVLVYKTEEPGSKQILAAKYNKLPSIARDMINHLVNDCIVTGATPLMVQDAIICGQMNKTAISLLIQEINAACQEQGCLLVGGETSEQPKVLPPNTYILTSSIVGLVEQDKIIDGSNIQEGDIVLGMPSSGPHTNGYTLIRQILDAYPELETNTTFMNDILEPHKCYYSELKPFFDTKYIYGLAHITGGGICENLNRILPSHLSAYLNASFYKVPQVFKTIKTYGQISDAEMLRTFNLGIGMAIVTSPRYLNYFSSIAYPIGYISKGSQTVVMSSTFDWR